MSDIYLVALGDGVFKSESEADTLALARFKRGSVMKVKPVMVRNPDFHRKFFALLNVGYEAFEPNVEYKGQPVAKNFERFRHDVTIMAGYYDMTVDLRGEPKAVPQSISFASMSQTGFEDLYSKVADVILGKVLTNYTKDDLDNVVNQILGFV